MPDDPHLYAYVHGLLNDELQSTDGLPPEAIQEMGDKAALKINTQLPDEFGTIAAHLNDDGRLEFHLTPHFSDSGGLDGATAKLVWSF